MGNFNDRGGDRGGFRGGDRGGRPSFGGGNKGGNNRGGDRGPVTMHSAVCDECNKNCEVPFRPSGDKPIYCSDCFGGKRETGDRGGRKDFGNDRPRREFDRPVASSLKTQSSSGDDMKNYFREINVKLDRLTSAIEKLSQVKGEVKKPFMKVAPVVELKDEVKKPEPKKPEIKKTSAIKVAPKKVSVVKAPAKKVVAKKGKNK